MDRHRGVISKLFFDPGDGSKLSERGESLADGSRLAEHGELPNDFQGTVTFYKDINGNVGYEVNRQGKGPFVELGFAGLRDAIIHFLRFEAKPEGEAND